MLMTRRLATFVLAFALAFPAGGPLSAQAVTDPDLKIGIQQVEDGDLETAVVTLEAAISRLAAEKGHEKDLATAHLYLAMTHLGLSQLETAKANVRAAWRNDKQMRLDPSRFPPTLIKMYEETQAEARAASPKKKKGGGGGAVLAVVGGGVAVAAGVAAASSGGPKPTPTPGAVFAMNARWVPGTFVCPDGLPGSSAQIPGESLWTLQVDFESVTANSVFVNSCNLTATIIGSDFPGEVGAHTGAMPCNITGGSPISMSANITRTASVVGIDPLVCINGSVTKTNHWQGTLTLQTSKGRYQLTTQNNLIIVTPAGR
jgi:hypothetical protein